MPHMLTRPKVPFTGLAALAALLLTVPPAAAATSTSRGQISVAQVQGMLDRAPTDKTAQQVLTAYLAGIGETADATLSISGAACRTPMSLSAADVRAAIQTTGGQDATAVAATPLIVRDMLARAGCQRT